MKKWTYLLLLFTAALFAWQCSENPIEPKAEQQRELTASEEKIVSSGNSFGLKLFKEIVAEDEPDSNIFISPLSVAMALGMTYNGANGETQAAMARTLELQGLSLEEVNKSYRSLIDLLTNLDPKVKFQIANSIWHADWFVAEEEFLDLNRTYFDAIVRGLDFEDPQSVDTINNWVDENTNGKIKKILDEIPPQIVMYLINAIYFKGDWTYEFDKDATEDHVFHINSETETVCKLMYQRTELGYYESETFQAVDLPYGDGEFSMTIILPPPGAALDDLIAGFDQSAWEEVIAGLVKQEVDLFVPKFKLEYGKKLNDVLSALGMEIAFDPGRADFTRINRAGDLFIDEVKHKTFIQVDEEGTEAAAVTSVGIGFTSAPFLPVFLADRPFMFVIRDSHSGTFLFVGRLTKPELL